MAAKKGLWPSRPPRLVPFEHASQEATHGFSDMLLKVQERVSEWGTKCLDDLSTFLQLISSRIGAVSMGFNFTLSYADLQPWKLAIDRWNCWVIFLNKDKRHLQITAVPLSDFYEKCHWPHRNREISLIVSYSVLRAFCKFTLNRCLFSLPLSIMESTMLPRCSLRLLVLRLTATHCERFLHILP